MPNERLLIIGYGNPGRQDDGLGQAFIKSAQEVFSVFENDWDITYQANYQLTVEDALEISQVDTVLFVDASLEGESSFHFKQIFTSQNATIGSHSVSPEAAITLCETLYDHKPAAYLLGIQGYEFDLFEEKLSPRAEVNLFQAVTFIKKWLAKATVHA